MDAYAKAYREGYEAFGKGVELEDNPYVDKDENCDREKGWTAGWEDAEIEHEEENEEEFDDE